MQKNVVNKIGATKYNFFCHVFFKGMEGKVELEVRETGTDAKEQPHAHQQKGKEDLTREHPRRWFDIKIETKTREWKHEEEELFLSCNHLFKAFIFQREGTMQNYYYRIVGNTEIKKRPCTVESVLRKDLTNLKTISSKPILLDKSLFDTFYIQDSKRLHGPWCQYKAVNQLMRLSVHIAKWALDYNIYSTEKLCYLQNNEMKFDSLSLDDRLTFREFIAKLRNGLPTCQKTYP